MNHPLDGIKVLDLTRLLPGAVATMALVDLGADVIKVEGPDGGDYARWMGPTIDEQSVFFRMNNRGKRAIILDLKQPEGQAVLKKLAAGVDVLVEGFRPGVMARLGCDYEALKAVNPRLIYASLSGWGADGPYAALASHDLNYASAAGLPGAMETPQVLGGQVADIGGAYVMIAGILAALFRRERSGEGAFIDTSLSESALPFALYNWVEGMTLGVPGGAGALTGGLAYYRIYTAQDGKPMALAALEEKFWINFCTAVERPDLIEWHMQLDRQALLRQELERLFASRTAADWHDLLADADCCFSLVRPVSEIGDDPHYQARGMLGVFDDGTPWMRSPLRLSNSEPQPQNLVPGYGEHTGEVLRQFGYSDADVAALREAGTVR